MTTFTITTEVNYTSLTPKQGNDSFNINGGKLVINSDTRYGPNVTAATGVLGGITSSASLGGDLLVDGTSVRLIPFNNSSSVIPAYGSIITCSTGSAELLCVMSDKHGGIMYAAGAAMPASGWLKVRNIVGTFGAEVLGGISCSATGADEVGWIFLAGAQDKSHIHSRLGNSVFNGLKYYIGVTNGTAGQTFQLPFVTAESIISYPGVEIETSPGSNEYQFWPNAANKFTSVHCSTDSRSSFVGISNTGVLSIGRGFDLSLCGFLPPAGCKIRIPNIITQCTGTSGLAQNVVPNENLSKRYKSNYTSSGNIWLKNVTGSWYWSIVQAYNCYIRDLHGCDQILIQEIATRLDIDEVHSGLSNYAASPLAVNALLMQQCYNGGTVGKVSGLRAESTSNSGYAAIFVNLYDTWTFKDIRVGQTGSPTAINGCLYLNTCTNVLIDTIRSFTKRLVISTCTNVIVKEHYYADACVGTTPVTQPCSGVEVYGGATDVTVLNFKNWPNVANTHPYNGLIYCNTAMNVKFRFCGDALNPYNTGSVNPTGHIYVDGGNNTNIMIQRNWVTALRTSLHSGTNTTKNLLFVNNYTTDATKTIGPQQLDSQVYGNRHNGGSVPTSFIAVYGNSMWDAFTGDTTTRAALIFSEKTSYNQDAYVINSGTPAFTSQGAVVMKAIGDSVTWTWGWFIKGWTGLTSHATQGQNTANHLYEYDIDKGNGFSGIFKTVNSANLQSETGINPVTGFRLRIRISCSVASTLNRLDSFRIDGTTTLALQNEAMYPLDQATLTVTGVTAGSTVAVFKASYSLGDAPAAIATNTTTSSVSLKYDYDEGESHYIVKIRKPGFDPIELTYVNMLKTQIPVSQQENKDGFSVVVYGRGDGSTKPFVTISPTDLRIDIGNFRCKAEDVYDVLAEWQSTAIGISYNEAIRFDGTDMIMMNNWRFRRALGIYTSAGLDALPVVDGQANASPDDETNGSVDFKARSVRTYYINQQPVYTLNDFAAAVWDYGQINGLSAQTNLLKAKAAAETAVALTASI